MRADIDRERFLQEWSASSSRFDAQCELDDIEYSMEQLSNAVLRALLGRDPTHTEVHELVDTYLAEWNTCVSYPAANRAVVETVGRRFRLAVVSNTNHAELVPDHLAAMGIVDLFDAIVTSVEVGWRKPNPAIFTEALRLLGIAPSAAVFVGDNYTADFLGAQSCGIAAYLIDPLHYYDVPEDRRLDSLADLPARLGLERQ
jgi:putative hydrolase of the HAD superfamily